MHFAPFCLSIWVAGSSFLKPNNLLLAPKKPLIVHIREANEDSFGILKDRAGDLCGGVLHCFNASKLLLLLTWSQFHNSLRMPCCKYVQGH
ncbi:MAG: TatD family hydrolase, partial [Prevotella sp.]